MKIITALILILLITVGGTQAQNLKSELSDPAKKLDDAFDQNLRGWARTRGEPLLGSPSVLIEFWKSFDRTVKVSVVLDPVGDLRVEARRRKGEETDGIERAFVDGYCSNTVSLHRGRLGIYIWTETHLNLLSLNEKENSTLACSEDAATSKLIACFVNLALSGDLAKGKPIPKQGFLQRPCEQELVSKRLLGEDILRKLMNRY